MPTTWDIRLQSKCGLGSAWPWVVGTRFMAEIKKYVCNVIKMNGTENPHKNPSARITTTFCNNYNRFRIARDAQLHKHMCTRGQILFVAVQVHKNIQFTLCTSPVKQRKSPHEKPRSVGKTCERRKRMVKTCNNMSIWPYYPDSTYFEACSFWCS